MKLSFARVLSSSPFLLLGSQFSRNKSRVSKRYKGALCNHEGALRVNSQWDLLKNPQDARTVVDLNGDASFTFLVLQRVAAGNWISRCYMMAFLHHWYTIHRFQFGGFEDIRERNESVYNV